VLFHHDNAPVHSSAVAQQKITEWRFELLAHPPYSPDLGPSDFHLFPKLKKILAGKRFRSNEVINVVNTNFEALREESHFREGIEKLEKRWTKCVELRGDYVEKQNIHCRSKNS
jgi:histone-lysine N-methyltransferase SETMAR